MQAFSDITAYKQVCIIPFTRESLELYARLPPTPGELAEAIDMLRFIEHGYPVRMIETNYVTHAVDTPEDLKRVTTLMDDDPMMRNY